MPVVIFADDMQQHTGGLKFTQVQATSFRSALRELTETFPQLTAEVYGKFSVAIDGTIIHAPLMESFQADSEIVFIPRIASG